MSMNDRLPEGKLRPLISMPKIEKIWVFVALDPNSGNEGILAMQNANGSAFPLVASDQVTVDQFRKFAQRSADEFGVTVRLIEFKTRHEIEVLEPAPK